MLPPRNILLGFLLPILSTVLAAPILPHAQSSSSSSNPEAEFTVTSLRTPITTRYHDYGSKIAQIPVSPVPNFDEDGSERRKAQDGQGDRYIRLPTLNVEISGANNGSPEFDGEIGARSDTEYAYYNAMQIAILFTSLICYALILAWVADELRRLRKDEQIFDIERDFMSSRQLYFDSEKTPTVEEGCERYMHVEEAEKSGMSCEGQEREI